MKLIDYNKLIKLELVKYVNLISRIANAIEDVRLLRQYR